VNAITSAALDFSVDGRLADAVWDEQQSGHTTAGTFGKYLDAAVSAPGTLAAGAITEATITLPAEGAGTPTGALGLIQWIAGMFGWRKVVKDGTAITQYLADGTTPKTASTYTSLAGTDTINKAV